MDQNGDGWHDMGFGPACAQPNSSQVIDVDETGHNKENTASHIEDGLGAIDDHDDEDDQPEDDSCAEPHKYARLTYQSVKANCEEMCRYVQNDQMQLAEQKLLTD